MNTDMKWLEPWAYVFEGKRVLELGCGPGIDSQFISTKASSLIAGDLNINIAIDESLNENKVKYLALDHSETLPFKDAKFDVAIASLTLHYFSWSKTVEILGEISRVLANNGQLICRLNSTLDTNYGAIGHIELEAGLYDVNGANKRFFSEQDILLLFADHWRLIDLKHQTIDRYEKPKKIWAFKAVKL